MEASSMVLLLLGLGFVSCTQSDVSIAFMEEQQGRYLQPGEGKEIELDHNAYVSVASALLNLGVIHGITPEQPQLVSCFSCKSICTIVSKLPSQKILSQFY